VITGFNTDIEHDGVVYHVQTEDKGLDSPLILSLVYAGGEILASKRSRYEDLIKAGFDEEKLSQRLKRQHRLICAAINAGRLEELKRMSSRPDDVVNIRAAGPPPRPIAHPPEPPPAHETESPAAEEAEAVGSAATESGLPSATLTEPSPYTVYDPRGQQSRLGAAPDQAGLILTVLDDNEFRAGESFTIRVLVEDGTGGKQKPLTGVAISVKILGTTFRPQIYSVKTERDGVATVSATMPNFTSGRAAVLIRAVANGETTEVRRVIYPAK
jgi:hypothetical protein